MEHCSSIYHRLYFDNVHQKFGLVIFHTGEKEFKAANPLISTTACVHIETFHNTGIAVAYEVMIGSGR